MSSIDIPINDSIPERKYIICCRKFDGVSAAACPCVGQIATNSKLIAYFLYRRWNRWASKNINGGYTIAVMLIKRNNKGLYDAIKR